MESFPIESLVLVVVASIVAFLVGRLTSKGQEDIVRLKGELEENRKAFQGYREQVTSHFRGTAQRVDALTQSYRDVYKHLAQGAQELCEKAEAPQLLEELKPNPMLSEDNVESPDEVAGWTSSDSESEKGSQSQGEPEKASEHSERGGEEAVGESEAKSANKEKHKGDGPARSKASSKDEPDTTVEERVREAAI